MFDVVYNLFDKLYNKIFGNCTFEITNEKIDQKYNELLELNFKLDTTNISKFVDIDFKLDDLDYPIIYEKIYADIDNYVNNNINLINVKLEKLRVTHIINDLNSYQENIMSNCYSVLGLYFGIIFVFVPIFSDYLKTYCTSQFWIWSIVAAFILFILLFVCTLESFLSINKYNRFNNTLSHIFYSIYSEILTKNSN